MNAWLGCPPPLEDETLSSWFRRVATENGLNARELYRAAMPGGHLFSYDLDRTACISLTAALSVHTLLSQERITQMTLNRWNGIVTEDATSIGSSIWLPTVGRASGSKNFGQQICPSCLREDSTPYYRIHWRLSQLPYCTFHAEILVDRCPCCGQPIQVLKSASAQDTHLSCAGCGFDFRRVHPTAVDKKILPAHLHRVLLDGWGQAGEYRHIHAVIYFRILYVLVRLLVSGHASHNLRKACAQIFDEPRLEGANIPRLKQIERLTPRARMMALTTAERLLQDWPTSFISACKKAGLTSRHLLKGNQVYPFAFEDPIKRHLSKSRDKASSDEIVAAAEALKRRDIKPTRIALEETLGKKFKPPTDVVVPGRECIPYGTHRYWKLDGVSPEVRARAKIAARLAGENVGAWVDHALRRVLTENTTNDYI